MSETSERTIGLSVVIPAFNAERHIGATVETVAAFLADFPRGAEIIVVDDGSHDATVEAARKARSFAVPVKVLRRGFNLGKGASVKEGILAAAGEIILFSDDDLSTPIGELGKLVAALEAGADVAIGSRALPGSDIQVRQGRLRETLGKAFNYLVRLLVLKGYRDTQCGFKAFRRPAALDIFPRLRTAGFGFDVEVLVLCRELGYRVAEVPVVWRDFGPSRLRYVGGSFGMLKDLLRVRRAYRRRARSGKARRTDRDQEAR